MLNRKRKREGARQTDTSWRFRAYSTDIFRAIALLSKVRSFFY